MEAQIYEIATGVGRELINPVLLAVVALGVLAVLTGGAARVAIIVEDFLNMTPGSGQTGALHSREGKQ